LLWNTAGFRVYESLVIGQTTFCEGRRGCGRSAMIPWPKECDGDDEENKFICLLVSI
jgi:hypothetical protein